MILGVELPYPLPLTLQKKSPSLPFLIQHLVFDFFAIKNLGLLSPLSLKTEFSFNIIKSHENWGGLSAGNRQ